MKAHWQGYLNAIGAMAYPDKSIDLGVQTKPFPNTTGNNISSGFQEWRAQDPDIQAKYDAMSGSWQGIQASESKGVTSVFKPISMPVQNK